MDGRPASRKSWAAGLRLILSLVLPVDPIAVLVSCETDDRAVEVVGFGV